MNSGDKKKVLEAFISEGNKLYQDIDTIFLKNRPPSGELISDAANKWSQLQQKILGVMGAMYESDYQQSEFISINNHSAEYRAGNIPLQNILKDITAKMGYLRKLHDQVRDAQSTGGTSVHFVVGGDMTVAKTGKIIADNISATVRGNADIKGFFGNHWPSIKKSLADHWVIVVLGLVISALGVVVPVLIHYQII